MLAALPLIPLAALGTLTLWLGWRTAGAARARRAAREGYFREAAGLFDRVQKRVEPTGFARMAGHLDGHAFDLQAIPDTLTFRKLPALWVMVSLPAPVPVGAVIDIMARPTGQEHFSHFGTLPHSLPLPDNLPEGTGVRSDNAAGVPPMKVIAPHLAVFADPAVKELVISPRGIRVVVLGEEADRGRYLLFRDAEMGLTPFTAARLRPLVDRILALRDDLAEHAGRAE